METLGRFKYFTHKKDSYQVIFVPNDIVVTNLEGEIISCLPASNVIFTVATSLTRDQALSLMNNLNFTLLTQGSSTKHYFEHEFVEDTDLFDDSEEDEEEDNEPTSYSKIVGNISSRKIENG